MEILMRAARAAHRRKKLGSSPSKRTVERIDTVPAPVHFVRQNRANALAGQRMFFANLLQCSPLRKSGEHPAVSVRLAGHFSVLLCDSQ